MIYQIIKLNLKSGGVTPVVHAVQNDESRRVEAIITDQTILSTDTARLYFIRPDGSRYNVACTRVLADNAFTANITQALTQKGIVDAQLKITTDGGVVSSYTFKIDVQEDTNGIPLQQMGYTIDDLIAAASSLVVDPTLSNEGESAEAKATGTALYWDKDTYYNSPSAFTFWIANRDFNSNNPASPSDMPANSYTFQAGSTLAGFNNDVVNLSGSTTYYVWCWASRWNSSLRTYLIMSAQTRQFYVGYSTDRGETVSWSNFVSVASSLSVMYFGDSIVRGSTSVNGSLVFSQNRIPDIVASELGINVQNFGIGNIGWLAGITGNKTNALGYLRRVGNSSYYSSSDTVSGYKFIGSGSWADFNTIVLSLGANDTNYPLGSLSDIDDTLSYESVMSQSASTIIMAMYQCYRYIKNVAPHISIVLVDPIIGKGTDTTAPDWRYDVTLPGGYTRRQLNDLYSAFATKYGISHVSTYDAPINRFDIDQSLSDGVHPTDDCYKQLGLYFAGKLRGFGSSGENDSSALESLKDYIDSQTDILSARIDEFETLPPGSTSGNAELLDVRNKVDGTSASSAGNAVREQITAVTSSISTVNTELLNLRIKEDGTTASSAGDAVRSQIASLKNSFDSISDSFEDFTFVDSFSDLADTTTKYVYVAHNDSKATDLRRKSSGNYYSAVPMGDGGGCWYWTFTNNTGISPIYGGYQRTDGSMVFAMPNQAPLPTAAAPMNDIMEVFATYYDRPDITYGGTGTLFDTTTTPSTENHTINCSETTYALLYGIRYQDSRYASDKNSHSAYSIELTPSSRKEHVLFISELVEYFAEHKRLFTIPADAENPLMASGLKEGDVLFTSAQASGNSWERDYYSAGHTQLVVKVYPESGYALVAQGTGSGVPGSVSIIQDILYNASSYTGRTVRLSLLDVNGGAGTYYQIFARPNYGPASSTPLNISGFPILTSATLSAETSGTRIGSVRPKFKMKCGKPYTLIVRGRLPQYDKDLGYLRIVVMAVINGAATAIDIRPAYRCITSKSLAAIPFILPYDENLTGVNYVYASVRLESGTTGGTYSVDEITLVEGFDLSMHGSIPITFEQDSNFEYPVENYSYFDGNTANIRLEFDYPSDSAKVNSVIGSLGITNNSRRKYVPAYDGDLVTAAKISTSGQVTFVRATSGESAAVVDGQMTSV